MKLSESVDSELRGIGLSNSLRTLLEAMARITFSPSKTNDPRWMPLVEPRRELLQKLRALTEGIDGLEDFRWKENRGMGTAASGESMIFAPRNITSQSSKPYLVLLFDRFSKSQLSETARMNFSCYFALGSGTSTIKFQGQGTRPKNWKTTELKRRRDVLYANAVEHINWGDSNFKAIPPDSTDRIGAGSIDPDYTAIDAMAFKYSLRDEFDDAQLRRQFLLMIQMYVEADLKDISLTDEAVIRVGRTGVETQAATNQEGTLERIEDLLVRGKRSFLLTGAPGVGKTVTTRLIIRSVLQKFIGDSGEDLDRVEKAQTLNLQFHPAYSYEDFIEGIRPRAVAGGVEFYVQPGRLLEVLGWREPNLDGNSLDSGSSQLAKYLRFCESGNEPEGIQWRFEEDGAALLPFFVVIDELNRANIPRVFGELLMLIEDSKRGKPEFQVVLPTSGRKVTVPPNIIFLCTMNSADRSIRHLDAALMRRFSIVRIPVEAQSLAKEWSMREYTIEESSPGGIANGLNRLNEKIRQKFEELNEEIEDRQIGPAYLWPSVFEAVFNKKFLESRFEYGISPLLAEFVDDDFARSVSREFVEGFPELWQ